MTRPTSIFLIFLLAITASISHQEQAAPAGMFGKLATGIRLAGKLLGFDEATGVAELVSEAFGKTDPLSKKGDEGDEEKNIFSGFLRILGFDAKKVGAIAVNAIIFVAQLISTSFITNPSKTQTQRENVPGGTPFEWMMNSSYVSNVLNYLTDRELPDHVIQYIRERNLDEETGCIQQLICKSSPFIWGMQRALNFKPEEQSIGREALFAYFPNMEEVEEYADKCEGKYPYCFFIQ